MPQNFNAITDVMVESQKKLNDIDLDVISLHNRIGELSFALDDVSTIDDIEGTEAELVRATDKLRFIQIERKNTLDKIAEVKAELQKRAFMLSYEQGLMLQKLTRE